MVRKLVTTALALLVALAIPSYAARASGTPVSIDYFELEDHRIAGATSFRSADAPRRDSATVYLDILIDANGHVASVSPSPDNNRGEIRRWYRRAQAIARQWRFRPFLRDGRAVEARARGQVDVLRPERAPRRRRAFPSVPLEDYSITLSRGGCFGSCPAYSVTIRGNGQVRFEGFSHTAAIGVRETAIPVERVERLVARFRAADFWSLDDRYASTVTDSPEFRLEVRAGSRRKAVVDYVGLEAGMPEVVRALEAAVDEAAGTAIWVRGDGRAE